MKEAAFLIQQKVSKANPVICHSFDHESLQTSSPAIPSKSELIISPVSATALFTQF